MKKGFGAFVLASFVIGFVTSGVMAADIGFKGVGVRLGLVMPEDPLDNTIGFGGHIDLGTIIPNLKIEGSIEYWSAGWKEAGIGDDWSWGDIAFLGTAKYMFPLEGLPVSPYAGGGLGLHHFSYDTWAFNQQTMQFEKGSESSNELQFHLLGGVEYPVSPQMAAFGEAKYVVGDLDYFGIYGGITYYLGTSGEK